ncbi:MAG: hypothetical protein GY778_21040, partial [bacterium]|nr:hypothetical protein [bacterium]
MAHLILGLHQKKGSREYAELARQDIRPERLRKILGLPPVTAMIALGGSTLARDVARLHPQVALAIKNAHIRREQAGGSRVTATQLLMGALSVTESTIIQRLAKEPKAATDSDSASTVDVGAENRVVFDQKVDTSVSTPERVLLKKVGATSIYIQNTFEPWAISADAFTISTDQYANLRGGLALAVRDQVENTAWNDLEAAIAAKMEGVSQLTPTAPLLVELPPTFPEQFPPYLFVATAYRPYPAQEYAREAAIAVARLASDRGFRSVTISLLAAGAAGLDSGTVAVQLLEGLVSQGPFVGVETITLTTIKAAAVGTAVGYTRGIPDDPDPGPDPPPTTSADPVSVRMVSDEPIERADQDRLDFKPYARALTGLINEENTHTPLTLAINARWGVGKSSLGKMVKHQLETQVRTKGRSAHRTCWFNAWMHDDAG